jgi:hypothetical protein
MAGGLGFEINEDLQKKIERETLRRDLAKRGLIKTGPKFTKPKKKRKK